MNISGLPTIISNHDRDQERHMRHDWMLKHDERERIAPINKSIATLIPRAVDSHGEATQTSLCTSVWIGLRPVAAGHVILAGLIRNSHGRSNCCRPSRSIHGYPAQDFLYYTQTDRPASAFRLGWLPPRDFRMPNENDGAPLRLAQQDPSGHPTWHLAPQMVLVDTTGPYSRKKWQATGRNCVLA